MIIELSALRNVLDAHDSLYAALFEVADGGAMKDSPEMWARIENALKKARGEKL